MQHATSADGTTIAYDRTGSRPALVLVVGAFSDRSTTKPLTAILSARYDVFEYDRRGRGDSGESDVWSVEREIEDLAAILALTGQPAFVFGHSSGGALALEAAAAGLPIRSTAVYEVPYVPGPSLACASQLDALLVAGRAEETVESFLALFTPPHVLGQMKSSPYWARLTDYAPSLPREVRLSNDEQVPTDRFAEIAGPVLALAGDNREMQAAARAIADAVPTGRTQLLAGQTHAVDDAVLSSTLTDFFQP